MRPLTAIVGICIGAAPASAEDGGAWSDRDEIRAIVAELLADAESRSSLLDTNGSAGYDGSFYLADPNGNFRLNVRGFTQFRYVANIREDNSQGSSGDEAQLGFTVPRTELLLNGHVISPSLFFQTSFQFTDSLDATDFDSEFVLEDAFVGYRFDNNWFVKWGQFKPAFLREFNVADTRQLAVERSLVNYFFFQNRTQGVELGYEGEDFRAQLSFNEGFNSANTAFNDRRTYLDVDGAGNAQLPVLPYPQQDQGASDYGVTFRGELKLNGTWRQFDDFTGFPKDRFGVMIGAAFHYEGGQNDDPNAANSLAGEYDFISWTADISLEGPGWNVFAAVVGAHSDVQDLIGAGVDRRLDDYGIVVQGGWFVPDTDWEIFARWDAILGDDVRSGSDDFQTITFGTNWYWSGHAAKFTADFVYFLDDATALAGPLGSAVNLLPQSSGLVGFQGDTDDGEFAIRVQFQLMF